MFCKVEDKDNYNLGELFNFVTRFKSIYRNMADVSVNGVSE
jgi:hypothetical protein